MVASLALTIAMKNCARGTKSRRDGSLSVQSGPFPPNGDAKLMAGILLWLMGVPLVVILLLYLIF
jgi:hypothetical protein